jgi:hypothetical protein
MRRCPAASLVVNTGEAGSGGGRGFLFIFLEGLVVEVVGGFLLEDRSNED